MAAVILVISALFLIFLSIYYTSKRKSLYWRKREVPYLQPIPILGNFAEYIFLRKYLGHVAQELCQKFPDQPYVGAFYGTEPTLVVQDLELIKLIMTKDFYFFNGREISKYNHRELFTQNLFFTYGDKWKVLRQNLSPLFSSAKMRNMFYLIEKCSRVFETVLDKETKNCSVLEVRGLMARFTMDCIGSCAFGVDSNTMGEVENNPFKYIGNAIFDTRNYRALKNIARAIWPAIFYGLGMKSFPTEVDEFFSKLLKDIFQGRHYKPSTRNDFVDLILKLKTNKSMTGDSFKANETADTKINFEIDDEILVSQCILFFAAGYETSATTSSFALFELAKNHEAQNRVLDEVDAYLTRHGNRLKYDCISEMPFMEACVDEALRLYPVLGVITREVIDDYKLPSGLKLHKGVRIHLPVYHLHHNPDFFPEPHEYKPERFFGDEKQNIKQYSYIPFGEGPRVCIGKRFAKMQVIAGLITVFKKYRVELAEGQGRKISFEPRAIVTQPIGGINLKFVVREGWERRLLKAPKVC